MAEHFAQRYGPVLAHSSGSGWMKYTGTHWEKDNSSQRMTLVEQYADELREHSERLIKLNGAVLGPWAQRELEDLPETLQAWAGFISGMVWATAHASSKLRKLRGIEDILALALPKVAVSDELWDRHPHLLAVKNGHSQPA